MNYRYRKEGKGWKGEETAAVMKKRNTNENDGITYNSNCLSQIHRDTPFQISI